MTPDHANPDPGGSDRGVTAVIPVRAGALPAGAVEAVTAAGGRAWLIGSQPEGAVDELVGLATDLGLVELGAFQPLRWAAAVAELDPGRHHLLVPHCPDGRDLAPHLAVALGRPLVSGATELGADRAVVAGYGCSTMTELALDGPVVATHQPGAHARSHPDPDQNAPTIETLEATPVTGPGAPTGGSIALIEELPADPATIDLAEAGRIVAAGAGLSERTSMADIEVVAELLDASVGATRVVTDWGWLPVERQIGTTGVSVDPEFYLAVGISGAIQHTAGLGAPDHVVVVNTDPSCPMMDLADLGLVCDGPQFLVELARALAEVHDRPRPAG